MVVRWFRVRGKVQGVGFRAFVASAARELDLHGRVRNEPDGSVTVVTSGESERLDLLEKALGQGPRLARVRTVERGSGEPETACSLELEF